MKIPEDRRLAACEELTKLAGLLNKGAASLYAKAMLLAHPDPKQQSKGLGSLTRYQTYGDMPCREEAAAIEARLRGQTFEQVKQATESRLAAKEREQIASEARCGMIEGDWRDRLLLDNLHALPEESQRVVFDYLAREAIAARQQSAISGGRPQSTSLRVIEGGARP
ncbi:MAG: hypothetical protein ACFCUT_06790 [Kiloniellaceae bacterium]